MEFIGTIDEVVKDYNKDENQVGTRIYIKMVDVDENLNERSIYCRVQGRKAVQVLLAMDEAGNVPGVWSATVIPQVIEYPGTTRTIHANLLHATRLERMEVIDVDMDEAEIVEDLPFPEVSRALPESKRTGIIQRLMSRLDD